MILSWYLRTKMQYFRQMKKKLFFENLGFIYHYNAHCKYIQHIAVQHYYVLCSAHVMMAVSGSTSRSSATTAFPFCKSHFLTQYYMLLQCMTQNKKRETGLLVVFASTSLLWHEALVVLKKHTSECGIFWQVVVVLENARPSPGGSNQKSILDFTGLEPSTR